MCGREPLVFQPPGSDCRARDSRAKVSLERAPTTSVLRLWESFRVATYWQIRPRMTVARERRASSVKKEVEGLVRESWISR